MKKMFLTSGIIVCMACPAFATDPTGITASGGAAQPGDCVEDVLGVASGSVTLEPKWSSNISGAITLDAKRYTSASDETGTASSPNVNPTTVYSKYADGLYEEAAATTAVTTLTQTPVQTGYTFAGFFTSKYSGGTEVISANGSVLPAASTQISSTGTTGTYYAQWTANHYNVTYNKGNSWGSGTNYTHTNGATYDQNYTIPSSGTEGDGVAGASTPTPGHTFVGWSTDQYATVTRTASATATNTGTVANAWTGETPWTRTADLTVYAAYLANQYTVSYLCGGVDKNNDGDIEDTGEAASGTVADQVVEYATNYALNNGAGCSLKGYTFRGWSCTNDLVGSRYGAAASGTWELTNDSTCTAIWSANYIGLKWDNSTADDGGTGGATSCSYDSAITPLPSNPTKTGYTFDGWQIKPPFDLRTITGTNLTDEGTQYAWRLYSSSGFVASESMLNEYGISKTSDSDKGRWGVTLADGSTKVRGKAVCGLSRDSSSDGWAGETKGQVGTPQSYNNSNGVYCWCKVNAYQASGSSTWQDVSWGNSPVGWVFYEKDSTSSACQSECPYKCARYVRYEADFRQAVLFGQSN